MFKFVLISALVAGASAGYASSQYAGAGTSSGLYNQVNSNFDSSAYADKYPYTNTGYNGGFTSNFAGPNGVGVAAGSGAFTPGFATFQSAPAFPPAFNFNGFYQGLQANFAK
uniref:(northern house mosquito) hypothetical protein n=1 Tax=Culex pipiens TaxID=7175 RepID=A0A8D8DI05_CULPI